MGALEVEEHRKVTPPAPIPFEARKGRTANPVQTTALFGVKRGVFPNGVDGGNPLVQMEREKGTRSAVTGWNGGAGMASKQCYTASA